MDRERTPQRFFASIERVSKHGDLVARALDHRQELLLVNVTAQVGDIVDVKRVRATRKKRFEVERVFHAESVAELATDVAFAQEQGRREWPSALESVAVPELVDTQSAAGREDLRGMAFVTIDGSDARDFDDAVFCEPRGDGWRLVVAIADVAHYVPTDSALDREAFLRGTSTYLPGIVVPMLPEALSNGICSLKPNEDRLALVCDMYVNADGEVEQSSFCEAVIRSHARLTYRAVANFLRHGTDPQGGEVVRKSILAFYSAYEALDKAARGRGSLDFHTIEAFVTTDRGMPTQVVEVDRNHAHRMIELAMVATNVQAAEYLKTCDVAPLHRVHEAPVKYAMAQLKPPFRERGIEIPDEVESPLQLQEILTAVRSRCKPAHVWESLLLACMEKAQYSPHEVGHFGLALEAYAHFTSPIRRYPDLVNHRQIKATFQKSNSNPLTFKSLLKIGARTSMCERRAVAIERRVDGWLKAYLLRRRIGESFHGTVTGIQEFGLFVELDEYFLTGLLHVSELPNDYYVYVGDHLVGEHRGQKFHLGDRLKVVLREVRVPTARLELGFS